MTNNERNKKAFAIGKLSREYVYELKDGKAHRGFITKEWVERVSDELELKELSNPQLSEIWEMIAEMLESTIDDLYEAGNAKEAWQWIDTKSAFLEVVNAEARSRRGM